VVSEFRMRLDYELGAPIEARHRLRNTFSAAELPDEVIVVVSELVTNAVLHGFPPIELRLTVDDSVVRIEVSDARRDMGSPVEESRGLQIIGQLANAWGVRSTSEDGKIVWADVAVDQPS
jgi:anti-sigma regulatory factor (Ser/Thr protein kinase)